MPARLGGLGINNPVLEASENYAGSQRLTATLVALIMQQSSEDGAMPAEPATKRQLHFAKRKRQEEAAKKLLARLPRHLKRAVLLAQENGASSWLSMLPLEEHGFALFKREFRDALCIRYAWPMPNTATECVCVASQWSWNMP